MSTLLSLDNDTFSWICQYLKINELAKLEQCNKFLLNTIKSSPHCMVALNYAEWNIYLKSQLKDFNRLSCVKKLYLNNITHYFIQQTTDLKQIINHLTHLTIHSIDPSTVRLPDVCPKCNQHRADATKTHWQKHFNTKHRYKCRYCPYRFAYKTQRDQHVTNAHKNNSQNNQLMQNNSRRSRAHYQSLESLTVYSMKYNKIVEFLNYINCDIRLLDELILNVANPDIPSTFAGKLYDAQLTKLCINSVCMEKKVLVGANTIYFSDMNKFFKIHHTHLKLFTSLRYFSCKKPRTRQMKEIDDLTSLAHQIITYCKNLEHLEFRNMSATEYNIIFGDNIQIKSNKLKELIIHMSSPKLGNLLQYLCDCNINLELIDVLLFDKKIERSMFFDLTNILHNLQSLLVSQLTKKTSSLRDIVLQFNTQCTALNEIKKWNVIQSVYSLLVETFKNENIKYRKELNVKLKIFYHPITNKQQGRLLEYDKLMQLLDILNEKVECCTIVISLNILTTPFKKFLRQKDFDAFLYHLQCNHEWNATIIKQKLSQFKQYTKYKITNYSKYSKADNQTQEMNNICVFESRLNYEQDGYIVCNDHDQILVAETMIFKIPKFQFTNLSKMKQNCQANTKTKIKWSEEHQLTFGSSDLVSVFENNDKNSEKNIDGEWNFEVNNNNNDSNGWKWHFAWNDNAKNKSNDNKPTWKWNLNDSDK